MENHKSSYQELEEQIKVLEEKIENMLNTGEKLKQVFYHSPVATEIYDENGNLIDCNPACLSMFGINSVDEVTGFNLFEDPNLSNQKVDQIKSGNEIRFELTFDFDLVKRNNLYNTSKSGKYIYDCIIRPFLFENQTQKGYFVLLIDITKHKQTEQELIFAKGKAEESEIKYKAYFDQLLDGIVIINPETATFIEYNDQVCIQLGYTREEFSKLSIFDIEASETVDDTKHHIEQVIKWGRHDFETKQKNKNGEIRNVYVSARVISILNKPVYHCIWRDITEFRRNEAELITAKHKAEENEIRLNDAQQLSHIGSWDWIIESDKITWSKELYNLLGLDPLKPAPSLKNQESIFTPDSFKRLRVAVDNCIYTQKPFKNELEMVREDGNIIHVLARGEVIKDKKSTIVGLKGTVQNITERKKIESIIQQQNIELKKLNDDKDRFFTILAHDLRNPFNSLLGLSDLLLLDMDQYDQHQIKSILNVLNQTSRKTFNLLEDLLLWSKSQAGKLPYNPVKVSLKEVFEESIEIIKNSADIKNISINYLQKNKVQIFADINMLKTIIRNLLSNAIKFTNNNGVVNINTSQGNNEIVISVADNGIGISKEEQAKLWDVTQQLSTHGTAGEKGSGFGLILCKELVEKHGGRIWVESIQGKGSEFKFSMPLYNEAME